MQTYHKQQIMKAFNISNTTGVHVLSID